MGFHADCLFIIPILRRTFFLSTCSQTPPMPGRVDCAEERAVCRDIHLTKFPSFVIFKVGGDYEIHYGKPSVQVRRVRIFPNFKILNFWHLKKILYSRMLPRLRVSLCKLARCAPWPPGIFLTSSPVASLCSLTSLRPGVRPA